MIIHDITDENFNENIGEGIVLIDFFATWCGPCKMLTVEIDELVKINKEVKVVKVDVDKCGMTAMKYGVMSVPTLILYKNGEKLDSKTGYMSSSAIDSWIKELVI